MREGHRKSHTILRKTCGKSTQEALTRARKNKNDSNRQQPMLPVHSESAEHWDAIDTSRGCFFFTTDMNMQCRHT